MAKSQYGPQYRASIVASHGKYGQLSRIGSRPHAFQRAIDKLRALPLTPPKGGS